MIALRSTHRHPPRDKTGGRGFLQRIWNHLPRWPTNEEVHATMDQELRETTCPHCLLALEVCGCWWESE